MMIGREKADGGEALPSCPVLIGLPLSNLKLRHSYYARPVHWLP